MESDKNYEDLIKKYQILLEDEKRRLTSVNFNLTESNEKNIVENTVQITELGESQTSAEDESSETSKTVVNNQEIVYNISKDTKYDILKPVSSPFFFFYRSFFEVIFICFHLQRMNFKILKRLLQ